MSMEGTSGASDENAMATLLRKHHIKAGFVCPNAALIRIEFADLDRGTWPAERKSLPSWLLLQTSGHHNHSRVVEGSIAFP